MHGVMPAPLMLARLRRGSPLPIIMRLTSCTTQQFTRCRRQQCRVSCTSTAVSVTSIAHHNPTVVLRRLGGRQELVQGVSRPFSAVHVCAASVKLVEVRCRSAQGIVVYGRLHLCALAVSTALVCHGRSCGAAQARIRSYSLVTALRFLRWKGHLSSSWVTTALW